MADISTTDDSDDSGKSDGQANTVVFSVEGWGDCEEIGSLGCGGGGDSVEIGLLLCGGVKKLFSETVRIWGQWTQVFPAYRLLAWFAVILEWGPLY